MSESANIVRITARRNLSDRVTKWVIGLGGGAVIGAIALIFAYLLWVVAPLLLPGDIAEPVHHNVTAREPVLVDISENGEVALRLSRAGIVEFYQVENGQPISGFSLGQEIEHAQRVYPTVDLYALVDPKGQMRFVRATYTVSFADGDRVLTPAIEFPFQDSTLAVGRTPTFDVQMFDTQLLVASANEGRLTFNEFTDAEFGFRLTSTNTASIEVEFEPAHIFMGPRNEWTYVLDQDGQMSIYAVTRSGITLKGQAKLSDGEPVAEALLGRYSIVVASPQGITQWGAFKEADGIAMKAMRSFDVEMPVRSFVVEPRRKGFASVAENGALSLHYPTSGRTIDYRAIDMPAGVASAISPRSNVLVSATATDEISITELDNKHPEISFSTLWQEIWYEGYKEPIYSWQSSSADNDFEPKFSLTPLAFGTLKAAFYALLFAVPIAIMGAVYTAYFMSPAMRAWVKPGIEIMAALPTVILGFIGGLWLAPIIEANLSSILGIFVVLPVGLFLFALLWAQLPEKISKPFAGWYGLVVVPLIIGTIWLAFDVGPLLEDSLFGGDSRTWLREVMGLNYDQRNALVVGIVMGLAVIPTIFSIAEDAIYGVPTHLINGSLALGATPWQTLVRVVMLTASPGIFSAVMIGMGRAVGETMIVLMATGNTPLMDFNIFEGMRTFAANIAVELPESEVDSSHYRILFLAALVLFMLTFLFNTFAEIVRQRLRGKYGSL